MEHRARWRRTINDFPCFSALWSLFDKSSFSPRVTNRGILIPARSWFEAQRDESEESELTSSSPIQSNPVRCDKTKRTAISSTEVIRVFGSVDVDKQKVTKQESCSLKGTGDGRWEGGY